MKVLHILFELQFSGAELMLQTASERFEASGLETTILATGPVEGIYADYFRKLGWNVVHIPFQKDIKFFRKLYSFIKKTGFNVVHIHTEGAFIYKAVIAYLAGTKKIVSTVHNNFLFNGYLKHRRQLHHIIALKLLGVKFISISESVKHTEKSIYYTNTTLIHNWIDLKSFNKPNTNTFDTIEAHVVTVPIHMISVGKCLYEKQHQRILELIKELVNRGINCHYTHIGCGDLETQEKQWANDNNLTDVVTFIPHTNKVAQYLQQCNYYIMPSLFEGVGNACLEAMAAGLLCVVSDAPGLNTLITNNVNGIIADFSQISQVADNIIKVHNDGARYNKMIESAQLYVTQKHGVSNVEKMIQMYY